MIITSTVSLPPPILKYFNNALLSNAPKLYDDCQTLWSIYQYIKIKLQKKSYKCAHMDAKFIELEREFLEVYERAYVKEKEFEEKTGKPFQKPFDWFGKPDRRNKNVFEKIKYRKPYAVFPL